MVYLVSVDRDLCIQCLVAPNVCPEVFIMGEDNGKNRLLEKYSEETSDSVSRGQVPDELYDCVRKAADACPVLAIDVQKI
jgi:ferredoxin